MTWAALLGQNSERPRLDVQSAPLLPQILTTSCGVLPAHDTGPLGCLVSGPPSPAMSTTSSGFSRGRWLAGLMAGSGV